MQSLSMATDAVRESRLSTPAAEPSRKAASAPPEHPLRWPSGENVHVAFRHATARASGSSLDSRADESNVASLT